MSASGNQFKNWPQRSLNQLAMNRAADVIQSLGYSLPASVVSVSGSIVTVKFEILENGVNLPQVTIPLVGSEYVRLPIQPGCKGFVIPADAYIGNMSGLGTGTPDLTQAGNLSALVFQPIGNKNWVSVNGEFLVMYGETGVTIQATRAGGASITLDSAGIHLNGTLYINSAPYLAHEHGLTPSGNTLGVI